MVSGLWQCLVEAFAQDDIVAQIEVATIMEPFEQVAILIKIFLSGGVGAEQAYESFVLGSCLILAV